MGLGHVMRMVAVAEAAGSRGWRVSFVTNDPEGLSTALLQKSAIEHLVALPTRLDTAWLVHIPEDGAVLFDGYHFTSEDYRSARGKGACVAAMDDFATGEFDVDVLVIPTPTEELTYRTPDHTEILVGPEFAPLRRAFMDRGRPRSGKPSVLLVATGATDATGVLGALLAAIPRMGFREVIVMVGPGGPNPSPGEFTMTVVKDPLSVADLLDSVDIAVSTAGTTSWELMCMGVPTVLIPVADNQNLIATWADQVGAAISLAGPEEISSELPTALSRLSNPKTYSTVSRKGLELVDGRGADRILDALSRHCVGAV